MLGKDKTLEYGRLLGRKHYLILLVVLVMVDWVANVPVFTELLPRDPGAEQAWQELIANSERFNVFAGLYRLLARITFSPEVSLLALGVVTFLMFLGHVSGTALRRLFAIQPKDEPSVEFGLRSHRRQAWLPLAAGSLGIVLVLAFLFLSRAQLDRVTETRVTAATRQVDQLETNLQNANGQNDYDAAQKIEGQLVDAQAVKDQRQSSADYASGISAMNFPIFLLNSVLVIVATAGAYLESNARIETRLADPKTSALQARLSSFQLEALTHRQKLRALDSDIQASLAKARYLAKSLPLRDWQAKAKRLEGVIPLFRAENARQRGIDVQNVVAFQHQTPLDLPPVGDDESFELSDELAVWEDGFAQLRLQIEAFQKQTSAPDTGGVMI